MRIHFFALVFVMPILTQFVPAQTTEIKRIESRPEFETRLIDEINGSRQNPSEYSRHVREYIELLRGKVLYLPKRVPFLTSEGESAIKDAVKTLDSTVKLLPLIKSEILENAARSQLQDLLDNPGLSHKGKDGANLATRLARLGNTSGAVGENITYSDTTPRQAALTMLIDDGVPSRQHRLNILSPKFLIVGAACGVTSSGMEICVVIFGNSIEPADTEKKKAGEPPAELN